MVIAEIVSQHAEEAASLWLLRSDALRAPHYVLKDIAKRNGRVEAHLDGLSVAGEAIARITGLSLEKELLVATAPAPSTPKAAINSKPQKGADDKDAFADDPDEGLPMPDPAKLASWWRTNAVRFNKTMRYRNCQPHSRQILIDILHHSTLPDRHHAAFELALLEPTSPVLETHSFADRQRRELAKLRV